MIPMRYSEVVIRRRIDNTMAKKGPKGQTIKTKEKKNYLQNTTLNNSPVYIRQKRRVLEQIATEGFLGSS